MPLRPSSLATLLGLAAVYLLAGRIGLNLAFVHTNATAVWPPSGLAVAALLVGGTWLWPAIAAGAFLVNLSADGNVATSLAIAAGNTLEALVAAALVRHYAGGVRAFDQPSTVFRFAALAGVVSPMLSATIGAGALWLGGFAPAFWPVWLTWWLGDLGGVLTLAPVLVLWAREPRPGWTRAQLWELAGVAGAVVLACMVVFGDLLVIGRRNHPVSFLCILPLLWLAFRFGPRETATAVLPMAVFAVVQTLAGLGPFAVHGPQESLPVLQAFLGTFAVSGLAIASTVADRRRQAELERQLAARVQQAQRLESLGVLAGGIAHDFNNLLTGIMGHANLAMLDLAPGHPAGPSLRALLAASERAAALTRQMLAYSGKGTAALVPVDLPALVREVLHLLAVSLPHTVAIRERLQPVAAVAADVAQLQQVVMNLVLNAAEAIAERGTVTLTTGEHELDARAAAEYLPAGSLRAGRYVCLDVHDDGCGMDEATRARIFEPFFTTKFTGRGLGLSATLGIARAHGGGLHVASVVGRGSTFRLCLPPATTAAAATVPPAEAPAHGPGRVLVIDDEEVVRDLAARGLERHGFQVVCAANGREGIDLLDRERDAIDAVLLDLTMPAMSGVETAVELRRLVPDLPLILCSGFDENDARAQFGEDLTGFLQKPFTAAAAARVIARALQEHSRGRG